MLPAFDAQGYLPAGIHTAAWQDVRERLGFTERREILLDGLYRGLIALKIAGCQTAYIDGSFATSKPNPNDFDVCYEAVGLQRDRLDDVLKDFSLLRARQRAKYYGEFFPANAVADVSGRRYLDFLQLRQDSSELKGIIALDLRRLP